MEYFIWSLPDTMNQSLVSTLYMSEKGVKELADDNNIDLASENREFTVAQQQDLIDLITVYRNKAPYEDLEMVQIGMKLCLEFLDTLFQ